MTTLELVIGIILLVMALFLIVSILMQSGKSKKLSGTIAGGAEQFFGKQKGQAINKTLSRVTNVVAVVFVVLVFALLLINAKDTADKEAANASKDDSSVSSTVTSTDASTDTSKESSKGESSEASKAESSEASKAESSEASDIESSEASEAESSEASAA